MSKRKPSRRRGTSPAREVLPVAAADVCRRRLSDGLIVSTLTLEVAPVPGSQAAGWLRRCFAGQAQVGRIVVDGDENATPPRLMFRFEAEGPPPATFEMHLPITDVQEARQALTTLVNTRVLLLAPAPAQIRADGHLQGLALEVDVPVDELRRFAEAMP
jgi:hypothetical protein